MTRPAGGVSVGIPHHRFPQRIAAGVRGLRHRQLGVQVRPPQGPASPAHHLQQLRLHGHHRSRSIPAKCSARKCGTYNANTPDFCTKCGDPVGLQLKYDVAECEERGMTYSAPLKVTMRLTIFDKDAETGNKSIRDIKEQEVFFGDIPLMTENGTFIINGTERVIVSQLHRSPGVFFETANNRTYFLGKIIPYRGSWVEFEYDQKNVLYVRIDRKRKFLGTIFLRALGLRTGEEILRTFYTVDRIAIRDKKLFWTIDPASEKPTNLLGMKLAHSIKSKSGEEIAHSGRKINAADPEGHSEGRRSARSKSTSPISKAPGRPPTSSTPPPAKCCSKPTTSSPPTSSPRFSTPAWSRLSLFFPERDDVGTVISQTLRRDSVKTPQEALIEIYRKLRPGDPPTLDTATALFHGMFFDPRKYDFSRVGRLKFNIKLFENQDATSLEQAHPRAGGLLRHHPLPAQAAQEHRLGGRHRSPRQPPRARGRRVDGEPVPHRPGPHGTRHQGKDERLPGNVDGHAARPGQRQAGDGRDPRVLRLLAALAVHGSDQPALRDHPQAPSLGAWAGRSFARARRIRGPRRSPHALRPHLPDRDAGRSEHRPDLVAQLLRPHQRLRLHRVALPPGEGRPRARLRHRASTPATATTRSATTSRSTRSRRSTPS